MKLTRWEEYEICQERGGHISSGITLTSNPPWQVCQFCGTHYRTEIKLVEQHVPKPPTEEADV